MTCCALIDVLFPEDRRRREVFLVSRDLHQAVSINAMMIDDRKGYVDGDVSDDNDGDGSEDDDKAAGELFSLGCSVCVCGQQRNQTIDL